ncbi:hypothetical protein GALMADRAFT_1161035 [Galerina marginata CBS 339.88]|uniref:Uncharacterized protein n=1 Tax=Galerina marginata (strain CBS 339.88) TaxID=685588 RepID=A0A067S8J7_GALM3|nr:hypothetical protein GALMADRAFT_1161035 [Galerina marginata CBS 339.88]
MLPQPRFFVLRSRLRRICPLPRICAIGMCLSPFLAHEVSDGNTTGPKPARLRHHRLGIRLVYSKQEAPEHGLFRLTISTSDRSRQRV